MASWLSVEIEICVPGVDDGSDPEKFVAPQFIYDLGWANWRQFFLFKSLKQFKTKKEGE